MSLPAVKTSQKPRTLILDEFAPYRIVALAHSVGKKVAAAYKGENLTTPEWRVLAVVAQAENVAARDVVALTPMDKMSVSRAVSSLESKSFLKRSVSPADRRVAVMGLTPRGRAIFDRASERALKIEKQLLSTLDPDERTALESILRKLKESARA